ncbi:hypothetical protein H1D32_01320 [Anaerobacillus sp. CMMVII]|uniref:TadE/TadG family type IV pilus assembly protein n=1 Tax=Anaerobacillus sp. CMMVII TaxID=2755588 RepID=UPI0021B71C0C|nr:TadE/TadG family type IV pilus assembly protein [Anaerobacillus sp. CMMVII]MCT8136522.1 hypothetical protein [Anaerobacillus sp. CMMVII]
MMSFILSLIKKQEGGILPLVAISMTVLLGFSALVIDAGTLYLEKSKIQKAVDAAVLAGAQELAEAQERPEKREEAIKQAYNIIVANGVDRENVEINIKGTEITAFANVSKEMTFARIFGIKDTPVVANAAAQILPISAVINSFTAEPFGINTDRYPNFMDEKHNLVLKWDKDNEETGNFGLLDLGSGTNKITEMVVGGIYSTDPGKSVGRIMKRNYEKKTVTIPIYRLLPENYVLQEGDRCNKTGTTGKRCIQVLGFATVYITNVVEVAQHKASIYGELKEITLPSGSIMNENAPNFGTYEVILTK